MKKLLLFLSIPVMMISCRSYTHSYRQINVEKSNKGEFNSIQVSSRPVVDVEADFKKKITATSGQQKSLGKAKEEAYYKAIMDNNINIVVDPIYKIQYTNILFIYRRYKADIAGFAGYYKNQRSDAEEAKATLEAQAENSKLEVSIEDKTFEMRVKNLEKLAKIDAVASNRKSTYMLDTQGEACCGDGKGSSGGNFGEVHLLHTTDNKSSLIDEYAKLVSLGCGGCQGSSSSNQSSPAVSTSSSVTTSSNSTSVSNSGGIKGIIGKLKGMIGGGL